MLAAKQFDIVMGIDIHLVNMPPAPAPVPMPHPFIGIVFDPISFLPPPPPPPPPPPNPPPPPPEPTAIDKGMGIVKAAAMQAFIPAPIMLIMTPPTGASVFINGLPHGIAGGEIKAVPSHIPMGAGFFKGMVGNNGEIFMGSTSVLSEGAPLSRLGSMALSCQCVGMPVPFRKRKKPKATTPGTFLPTSVVMAIPMGRPVLVGGMPTVDFTALATSALSKVFGKWKRKASGKLHQKAHKHMDKKGYSKKAKNRVHRAICAILGMVGITIMM